MTPRQWIVFAIIAAVLVAAVAFRFTASPELRPSHVKSSGALALDQAAFEARLRNYLLELSEVIIEAIQDRVTRRQAEMVQGAIERNIELARDLRISGTPGFVIGDQILRGATDLRTMQSLVQRAREGR